MRCVLYCNPMCGHSRAVIARLRARGLPYEARHLQDPEVSAEVLRAYHLQGSPVLVIGNEVLVGVLRIFEKLDML